MRILVADDEKELVAALEELLKRERYTVDTVYDETHYLELFLINLVQFFLVLYFYLSQSNWKFFWHVYLQLFRTGL